MKPDPFDCSACNEHFEEDLYGEFLCDYPGCKRIMCMNCAAHISGPKSWCPDHAADPSSLYSVDDLLPGHPVWDIEKGQGTVQNPFENYVVVKFNTPTPTPAGDDGPLVPVHEIEYDAEEVEQYLRIIRGWQWENPGPL